MKSLDILSIPLRGKQLIEAGAGTGKTYTITSLYLRLILEAGLSPEAILVVTFTRAATEELNDRIRARLREFRRMAVETHPKDPLLSKIIERTGDRNQILERLDNALADFDQAAICTIHGFCHRVLRDHAFETGIAFDMELISDPSALQTEAASDFWRKQVYSASPELAAYIMARSKGPSSLVALIGNVSLPGVTVIPEPHRPVLHHLDTFRNRFAALRREWHTARTDVIHRLMDPALKGNVYGALRQAASESKTTPRHVTVHALVAAVDRLTDLDTPVWPISPKLEKFTADTIAAATRKNRMVPHHAFFSLFQEFWHTAHRLGEEMEAYWQYLKAAFIPYAHRNITARKQAKNILYYEDLLNRLESVLKQEHQNSRPRLADKVGQRYGAVLVDEFQDTDLTQYSIFSRLFETPDTLLCMIGDPKQAIYSFRGADLFSYLAAAERADQQHTLTSNWRSCKGLINAVNILFSQVEDPFVFPGISFIPGRSAPADMTNPFPDAPSLHLWRLPHPPGKTLPKGQAVHLLGQAVAQESVRLLSEGVPAGDIVVLVRTNRQARLAKAFLSKRQVPAVLLNAGNIFETDDAEEMLRVLSAISEPGRLDLVRGSLTTELLGGTGADFIVPDTEPVTWEDRADAFSDYHLIWSRYGFIQMFQHLAAREKIRERLLGLPEGERRLTNILHLAEILHRESLQGHAGITGTVKWLQGKLQTGSRLPEEHQLRLESDSNAIRILTVHGSKGLEFPIVFCPFMWDGADVPTDRVWFHDPARDNRLTLDLGSQDIQSHRRTARMETLAENLRLLYVGLTRAKFTCYTAWGRIRTSETAPLAYLIHGNGLSRQTDPFEALTTRMRGLSDREFYEDVERLARRSNGDIAVEPLPVWKHGEREKDDTAQSPLTRRLFTGIIDDAHRITSYTDLMRRGRDGASIHRVRHFPDYDAQEIVVRTGASQTLAPSRDRRHSDIASFPSGARAGAFFHDVLEGMDFMDDDLPSRSAMVTRKLAFHGFDPEWREAVLNCIENLLGTQLEDGLTLSRVARDMRLSELEFHFPLNPVTPESLENLFSKTSGGYPKPGLSEAVGRLDFSPVRGFLKGFIDLVFRKGSRFYLLDWKSNRLGTGPDAYDTATLHHTMISENYYLQYHLYVLALHLYLRERIPDYAYETHFGAVYYVFLRGLDCRRAPGWGVYRSRPPEKLIHGMVRTMVPQNDADTR